jgi:hypothetical protein
VCGTNIFSTVPRLNITLTSNDPTLALIPATLALGRLHLVGMQMCSSVPKHGDMILEPGRGSEEERSVAFAVPQMDRSSLFEEVA